MAELKLSASAKINLGLEVLEKRPDGYHEINTVLYRINLSDQVTITPADDIEIETEPNSIIPLQDNLIYKAARLLRENYPAVKHGAKIKLIKNIPVGAGLGGGSSDAASTLLGLACFWKIPVKTSELEAIALSIGCDVPFFFYDKCAVAQGKGEILSYFNFRIPYNILVVYPNINISTSAAYNSLKLKKSKSKPKDFESILQLAINNPKELQKKITNDFESYVFSEYPQIADIKSKLYSGGAVFALLTGSGSSVYGFFDSKEKAEEASKLFDGCFTHICVP